MTPDTILTEEQARAFREAAKPYLRAALRQGLAIGFVLGVVATCVFVFLAMAGGGR